MGTRVAVDAQGFLHQACALPLPFKVKKPIAHAAASLVPGKQGRGITLRVHKPVRLPPQRTRLHQSSLCRAQVVSSNITFHFDNTAVTVPLSQEAAVGLSKAIEDVLNTFREKEKAVRPRRWESMEFRHTEDGIFVEFFCNPNAHANLFQAKVLLTINDEKMKIVTEAQLSAIKSEVDQYVKAKV